MSGTNNR